MTESKRGLFHKICLSSFGSGILLRLGIATSFTAWSMASNAQPARFNGLTGGRKGVNALVKHVPTRTTP